MLHTRKFVVWDCVRRTMDYDYNQKQYDAEPPGSRYKVLKKYKRSFGGSLCIYWSNYRCLSNINEDNVITTKYTKCNKRQFGLESRFGFDSSIATYQKAKRLARLFLGADKRKERRLKRKQSKRGGQCESSQPST